MKISKLTLTPLILLLSCINCIQAQDPIDMVICFDLSGSMRFPLTFTGANTGTCNDKLPLHTVTEQGVSRSVHHDDSRYITALNILKVISSSYINVAVDYPMGPGIGDVYVVRFPGDPTIPSIAEIIKTTCTNPFIETDGCVDIFDNKFDDATPDASLSILTDHVNIDCTPYGTPLAEGLYLANDALFPTPPPQNPLEKLILLICDGEPTDAFNTIVQTDIQNELDNQVNNDVKIIAIGIGDYTSNRYFNTLNQIATYRQGYFFGYVPTNCGSYSNLWGGGICVETSTESA